MNMPHSIYLKFVKLYGPFSRIKKSAPYLRLKNSMRTSKCQVFLSTVPEKSKSWTNLARRREPLGFLNILQNIEKIEAGHFRGIKKFYDKKTKN